MTFELYSTFLLTVLVVMLSPGPSTVVAAVQSMTHGIRAGVLTALGDISANFLQMIAAVAGLGVLLSQSAIAFTIVKFLGVAYLAFLGIKMFFAKESPFDKKLRPHSTDQKSSFHHFQKGFLVAGTSPKAILFYGALFPQFLIFDQPLFSQFLLLAFTCSIIDFLSVLAYVLVAHRGASTLKSSDGGQAFNRVGGAMMLGAAGLLMSQRSP